MRRWEKTVRLYAARIGERDGWQLEESLEDADGFRAELVRRGLSVDEIVEIAEIGCWGAPYPKNGEPFKPTNYFHNTAYRAGWGYDVPAGCWRAPHEHSLRFPGPTTDVDRLDVTYALPDVGWLDTAVKAGGHGIEFSMSDVYNPVPSFLLWLERLADGVLGTLFMDIEGWSVHFHCFAEDDRVRFVVEEGDYDRSVMLDVRIGRIALLAGLYCPLVMLWESDAFARAYEHWDFPSVERDAWDAAWESLADGEDPERLTPTPIRSARIDEVLRSAGWDW